MTDMGRRSGDMLKSDYDSDQNGVVDDSESTALHATKHMAGGIDEIHADGLLGRKNLADRGDPSAIDYDQNTLISNGLWQNLDLSALVPPGATAIVLRVGVLDGTTGIYVAFRKNGNINTISAHYIYTQVANVPRRRSMTIFCDTDRVIEYVATNTTWTMIEIVVLGWWI